MTRTKTRVGLLGIGLLILSLLAVIAVFGFLTVVHSETLTENHSVALHYSTMLDNDLADWDTVFVVIKKADNTIVDTIGLAHGQGGRWYGSYSCSGLDGGYVREYYAVYSDDTTMESCPFSVIPEATLQGEAAGLDSPTVVGAMKQAATDNPDLFIDGACAGSGSEIVNIYIKDQSDSTGIGGVEVEIWDVTLNNLTAGALETQNSGLITFSLNVDTFGVVIRKDRWIFTIPETLYVTTDMDTTYYGQAYSSVSLPEGMCYVYGYIYHLNGDPCESCLAVISIDEDYQPVRHSGTQVMHQPDTAYTNSAGLWKMFLYQSSALIPDTTVYVFRTINPWSRGIYTEEGVEVPDSTEWFYGQ